MSENPSPGSAAPAAAAPASASPSALAELPALLARLRALEAERAVRRTMMRYMLLCDVPCRAAPGPALPELFTEDAIWQGIGPQYAHKFGTLQGRQPIYEMLTRYLPPTPHFRVNVHSLSSETIEVLGERAVGHWVMMQSSQYVESEQLPAELICARLEVDFVPAGGDAGQWLISHFRTERLYNAPLAITAPLAAPGGEA